MTRISRHLLNLYNCDANHLTTAAQIKAALEPSLNNNYLERLLHQFYVEDLEQGVTGLYMWVGGHLSIHTWPERKMAAIDIISPTNESLLIGRLMQNLPGRYVDVQEQAGAYNMGREAVGSFSQCANLPISPEDIIRFLTDVSDKAGFNVVGRLSYDAGEQIGAALVLSESHFALHVDKKRGIAYADCFTCGKEGDPCKGLEILTENLAPRNEEQSFMYR